MRRKRACAASRDHRAMLASLADVELQRHDAPAERLRFRRRNGSSDERRGW